LNAAPIPWKESDLELLRMFYPKSTKDYLLTLFPNRSWGSIEGKAKYIKVKRDTYKKPILDFSEIDTSFKAYLLGYIAADGYINLTQRKYSVCFSTAEKDKEFLDGVRQRICPEATLLTYSKWNDSRLGGTQCRFDVNNKELITHLLHWNLHPNKSLTLAFPRHLPKEMYWHWFRGFFDGDGTIQIQKKDGWPQCGFVGTTDVLDVINQTFNDYFPHRVRLFKPPEKPYHILIYGGLTAAVFLDRLYRDSDFYMERKFVRAEPFIGENLIQVSKKLNREIWFGKDVRFLLDNYGKKSTREISEELCKSLAVVYSKIRSLKLNETTKN
jgi:hypothetical protein